jgi:Xaa-Pro aminopeptidase
MVRPLSTSATSKSPGRITVAEYRERCARALSEADQQGLAGLIVWSRGGGPLDAYANVLYLTGHYEPFPAIPDNPGHWSAQGYSAVILSPGGRVGLATSTRPAEPGWPHDIVVGANVAELAASLMRDYGMRSKSVGLVGESIAPRIPWGDGLLIPSDAIVDSMRRVKSPSEQACIRAAVRIGAAAVAAGLAAAAEGSTEADVAAAAAADVIRHGGAVYNIFAEAFGPRRRVRRFWPPVYDATLPLRIGDTLALDLSGAYGGYFFDIARSAAIGDAPKKADALITLSRKTVEAVIEGLQPGLSVASAVQRGVTLLEKAGHSLDGEFQALGHGLGLGWEGPWLTVDNPFVLQAGMVLAVERTVRAGAYGAAYEDDVLITDSGPEILSAGT